MTHPRIAAEPALPPADAPDSAPAPPVPAAADPADPPPPAALAAYPDHAGAELLSGAVLAAGPDDFYQRLRREHGGVAPILLDGGVPAWFVLGYREVRLVTGNPQMFGRDSRRWNAWDHVPQDWSLTPYVGWMPSVVFAEGDDHHRRSEAVSDALDAIDRADLTAICAQVADHLLDSFAGDGEADLIAQYCHQLPLMVIARVLGMPESDIPALARDIADSLDEGPAVNEAHQRVRARIQHLVAARHALPGPDLPSRLLAHPAGLTAEDVVADLLVVMASAQQSTGDWIGNALRLMLVDDTFSVTLQGGRTSAAQALNEVLWHDAPAQNFIGRWALHDCELGGRRIRRGDLLVLGLAAANADPLIRPDSSGAATVNRSHLSFGHGEHGCPYPAPELAEIVARTAVEVLLDRIPDVELAAPAESLRWRPSIWMRGLFALPVRFTPTAHVTTRTG